MNIRVREDNCSIYISCSQKSAEHLTNMSPKAVLLVVGLLALISVKSAEAKNWALLVAGSNTYDNYRHQVRVVQILLCQNMWAYTSSLSSREYSFWIKNKNMGSCYPVLFMEWFWEMLLSDFAVRLFARTSTPHPPFVVVCFCSVTCQSSSICVTASTLYKRHPKPTFQHWKITTLQWRVASCFCGGKLMWCWCH